MHNNCDTMPVFLALLLITLDAKVVDSIAGSIETPAKLTRGQIQIIRCGNQQMSDLVKIANDEVKMVRIEKMEDDGPGYEDASYIVSIYAENTYEKRFAYISPDALPTNITFITADGLCPLDVCFPNTRYCFKYCQPGKFWTIIINFRNAPCRAVGLYRCSINLRKPNATKMLYLDTEDKTPHLAIYTLDSYFKNGSQIKLTCTVIRSIQKVEFKLKIRQKSANTSFLLPVEIKDLRGGFHGLWPAKDELVIRHTQVKGDCEKKNYYSHIAEINFKFVYPFLCESQIICEATATARGDAMYYGSLPFTETFSSQINLYSCEFPIPKKVPHTMKKKMPTTRKPVRGTSKRFPVDRLPNAQEKVRLPPVKIPKAPGFDDFLTKTHVHGGTERATKRLEKASNSGAETQGGGTPEYGEKTTEDDMEMGSAKDVRGKSEAEYENEWSVEVYMGIGVGILAASAALCGIAYVSATDEGANADADAGADAGADSRRGSGTMIKENKTEQGVEQGTSL